MMSILSLIPGRLEDSLQSKRNADTLGLGTGKRSGITWNNFSGHHAFTTGRGSRSNESSVPFMSSGTGAVASSGKGRPKVPSQTLKVRRRARERQHETILDSNNSLYSNRSNRGN